MSAPDDYEREILRRLGTDVNSEEAAMWSQVALVKRNVKELRLSKDAELAIRSFIEPYLLLERQARAHDENESAETYRLFIECFHRVVTSTFFFGEVLHGRVENPNTVIEREIVDVAIDYCVKRRHELIQELKDVYEAETSYEIDQLETE